MKTNLFLSFLIVLNFGAQGLAQSRILFTYVDYNLKEARAAIADSAGNHVTDIGFNKSHYPAWMGRAVLFNGENFIWKCDVAGNNIVKVTSGQKPSVSHKQDKFACYDEKGISLYDSAGKKIGAFEVEAWKDISITWTPDDEAVCYYDKEKDASCLFHIIRDSISIFGKQLYQPNWSAAGDAVYDKYTDTGFAVYYRRAGKQAKLISGGFSFPVAPLISRSGKYVAFLNVLPDSLQPKNSDMYLSSLILYNTAKDEARIIAQDAGFTDMVFPQFYFDNMENTILYTGYAPNGNGMLMKVNLYTLEKNILLENASFDYRFPVPKP